MRLGRSLPIGLTLILIIVLPLTGIWLVGQSPRTYFNFPPTTQPVVIPAFSGWVFLIMLLITVSVLAPFVYKILSSQSQVQKTQQPHGAFPAWGWMGVTIIGLGWVLSWSRVDWFSPLQPYTFTPLWLGYILVINALTCWRRGHCLLRDRPLFLLALFPVSGIFWWVYEYLNQFVHNWYYTGVGEVSAWRYVLYATPPFATVLPAVLSTAEWLHTFPRLSAGLDRAWRIPALTTQVAGFMLLSLGVIGLILIPVFPDRLFPLLWIAPLVLILGLQNLTTRQNFLSPIAQGNWRGIWLYALAALMCGFFWELWNAYSLAQWRYTVPGVQRYLLFEMPLLGYAGYLPFGLTCAAVVDLIFGVRRSPAEPLTDRALKSASEHPS